MTIRTIRREEGKEMGTEKHEDEGQRHDEGRKQGTIHEEEMRTARREEEGKRHDEGSKQGTRHEADGRYR